jgi:hypothetical protein
MYVNLKESFEIQALAFSNGRISPYNHVAKSTNASSTFTSIVFCGKVLKVRLLPLSAGKANINDIATSTDPSCTFPHTPLCDTQIKSLSKWGIQFLRKKMVLMLFGWIQYSLLQEKIVKIHMGYSVKNNGGWHNHKWQSHEQSSALLLCLSLSKITVQFSSRHYSLL